MTNQYRSALIFIVVMFLWISIAGSQTGGTMSAMPAGVSISGKIEASIEGSRAYSNNVNFSDGLVFALSPDTQDVLGFSYASGHRTGKTYDPGHFRIHGLPNQGDIILFAFKESVKRFYWMDLISMDEMAKSGQRTQLVNIGTVTADMRLPSRGPADLTNVGDVVLKGKSVAVQALFFAGWIAGRSYETYHRDYRFIDELTNRLYEYYEAQKKLTEDYQRVSEIESFNSAPSNTSNRQNENNNLDQPIFNTPYYPTGSNQNPVVFLHRDDEFLVQTGNGNVFHSRGNGFSRLIQNKQHQDYFLTPWSDGHGLNSTSYRFGHDTQNLSYVDITCDVCDEPQRFYPRISTQVSGCTVQNAQLFAANHFSPTCSYQPDRYKPVSRLIISETGRTAYVFASCAGPETRGNFTYIFVEQRAECKFAGSFTTSDPYPEFSIQLPPSRQLDGIIYPFLVPGDLHVRTSNFINLFTYNLNEQQYRFSRTIASPNSASKPSNNEP